MKLRTVVVSIVLAMTICLMAVNLTSAHTTTPTIQNIQHEQPLFTNVRPFINYAPCNDAHFVRIYYSAGSVCLANNGYMGLGDNGGNLFNVTKLHPGNNVGWVRCYGGTCGTGKYLPFGNLTDIAFNPVVEITQVNITGQV